MATIVIMPKQGLMMEEGTITSWLKKEGEAVTAGEPLFEMETDKLTITMDAEASGTLLKIIHPEGDVVPITQPIAVLGEPGEDISALLGGGAAPVQAAAPAEAAPVQAVEAPAASAVERAPGERVFSSPRARWSMAHWPPPFTPIQRQPSPASFVADAAGQFNIDSIKIVPRINC